VSRLTTPRHVRAFLASPGDVAEERRTARELLLRLGREPLIRGRFTIEVVSWDDPDAPAPMLASLTPQEAVLRALPKPSECDLTIVVLWAWMGTPLATPLKADGSRFQSGTEWEFEDARMSQKPLLLYRRTSEPVASGIHSTEEARRQRERVDQFFARFRGSEGSATAGYTSYLTPEEFGERLRKDVEGLLGDLDSDAVTEAPRKPWSLRPTHEDVARWWRKGVCFWNLAGSDALERDAPEKATRVLLVGLLLGIGVELVVILLHSVEGSFAQLLGFPLFFVLLLVQVALFALLLLITLRALGLRIRVQWVYVLVAYTLSGTIPLVYLLTGEQAGEALRLFAAQRIIGPPYLVEATNRLLYAPDAAPIALARAWTAVVLEYAALIAYVCVNLTRVVSGVVKAKLPVVRAAAALVGALGLNYVVSRYLLSRIYWLVMARFLGG
jgi:hypothetical protein